MPWPKGKPRPPQAGRKPGTPNKATKDVRLAIAKFAEESVDDFIAWLRQVDDPAKRCDLYLRTIEYHIPKLQRSDIALALEDKKDISPEERAVALLALAGKAKGKAKAK